MRKKYNDVNIVNYDKLVHKGACIYSIFTGELVCTPCDIYEHTNHGKDIMAAVCGRRFGYDVKLIKEPEGEVRNCKLWLSERNDERAKSLFVEDLQSKIYDLKSKLEDKVAILTVIEKTPTINFNLNYEGFEENLKSKEEANCPFNDQDRGVRYIFKFPNGYGASVVKHYISYGYRDDLWELAVLNSDGSICYSTKITDDVIGYLTDEDVRAFLGEIKGL